MVRLNEKEFELQLEYEKSIGESIINCISKLFSDEKTYINKLNILIQVYYIKLYRCLKQDYSPIFDRTLFNSLFHPLIEILKIHNNFYTDLKYIRCSLGNILGIGNELKYYVLFK
ncbi:hypothetical protein MXB_581 [Myxobolus squamalis]|nr:hypothetical protein MXB_581 [Myxobolus squamalis]